MKSVFHPEQAAEIRTRLATLTPTSRRQWGKMTIGQMLTHCSIGLETATGASKPPRMMIGRLLGWAIKPLALRNDDPMQKNAPTAPSLIVRDDRDFGMAHQQLSALFEQFVANGPKGCTTHPHAFFGRMTPDQWGMLMYKHLDHHLRQFAA